MELATARMNNAVGGCEERRRPPQHDLRRRDGRPLGRAHARPGRRADRRRGDHDTTPPCPTPSCSARVNVRFRMIDRAEFGRIAAAVAAGIYRARIEQAR